MTHEDCDIEMREANGQPIRYCIGHGQDASRCPLSVEEMTHRVYHYDEYEHGPLEGDRFVASHGRQRFLVTVTEMCPAKFTEHHHVQRVVTFTCTEEAGHNGLHASENQEWAWAEQHGHAYFDLDGERLEEEPDGAPCCPAHNTNMGAACDFPGYAENH